MDRKTGASNGFTHFPAEEAGQSCFMAGHSFPPSCQIQGGHSSWPVLPFMLGFIFKMPRQNLAAMEKKANPSELDCLWAPPEVDPGWDHCAHL